VCSNKHRRKYTEPRWKIEARKAYQRIYMKTVYKDKKNAADRLYHKKLKLKIFELLGGKCSGCGYFGPALQVDHIHNNGGAERRKYINGGSHRYWKNILNKIKADSKEYQLLCANCNWEKELTKRRDNLLAG